MASAAYRFDLGGGGGGGTHHYEQHDRRLAAVTSGGVTEMASDAPGGVAEGGEGSVGCCDRCLAKCSGNSGEKCTVAKVKSYLKMFLAQLFSHVGLCALVVGYSIMGAFIFSSLESGHEKAIRAQREDERLKVLNELYNVTGKILIM